MPPSWHDAANKPRLHARRLLYEIMEDAEESVAPHVRRLRQRALSDRLRESLLFLPLVLLIAGIALQQIARIIDEHVSVGWLDTFNMSPDAAQTLLSTIAGATITTAGVVFSLLVVSLQLASGQFSPRVLRTFWRDRVGQVLIGLLLTTFAFCVLALSGLDTSAEHAPTVTMALAIALALASILAIVGYLNRITRRQYVGRIMERIQNEALALIDGLPYGSRMGERCGAPIDVPDLTTLGAPLVVGAHENGWVQQISRRAVLAAVPAGSVVRLETRVGAYLVRGEPLARIWPRPDPASAAETARLVAEAAIIGVARTMQQDIDFGLRQLNDIGLRALSPAVNDQTTAIEVILRVSSVMRPLIHADLPAQAQRDDDGSRAAHAVGSRSRRVRHARVRPDRPVRRPAPAGRPGTDPGDADAACRGRVVRRRPDGRDRGTRRAGRFGAGTGRVGRAPRQRARTVCVPRPPRRRPNPGTATSTNTAPAGDAIDVSRLRSMVAAIGDASISVVAWSRSRSSPAVPAASVPRRRDDSPRTVTTSRSDIAPTRRRPTGSSRA